MIRHNPNPCKRKARLEPGPEENVSHGLCTPLRSRGTISPADDLRRRRPEGDGSLAEIFISNGKAGSDSDTAARDSAIVASIALQYGVPFEIIRHALMRNRDGSACGPLGGALDRHAEMEALR
jgi:hypothetical protein